MADVLLALDQVTAVRSGGGIALHDVSWTLHEGETWAIVGPVGSGKTSFVETIRGHWRVTAGHITWPMIDQLRQHGHHITWPTDVIQLVSFKEESPHFSYGKHYYQQRFNFIEPEDDVTLRAFLHSGTRTMEEDIPFVARRVGIESLLDLSLIKLSNGQTRRARIARALLAHPQLLILDDPFMGLDVAGRADIARLLHELLQAGQRLLLITRPDVVPAWITHVMEMAEGRIVRTVARADYREPVDVPQAGVPNTVSDAEPIVELNHVDVSYGDKAILRSLSWTICRGERWALLGPNGSGKTTLLSLIGGDHPQAYANDVRLFGRRRGTGESIWDIKRQIGMVSPELHLYFSMPLTVTQVVATGFFDVLVPRPTTSEQDAQVQSLLASFDLLSLAQRPFSRLSTGEQRLTLILRAFVKQPALLILDEPFQGLDRRTIERLKDWLNTQLMPQQTLLFVTHYEGEIPACVTRVLQLHEGQVLVQR